MIGFDFEYMYCHSMALNSDQ